MSGDCIQVLDTIARGKKLDFGESGVVPAQTPCAFPHGVVASHGVALPQRVLVGQLTFLQSLDQDGRLLIQFPRTAQGCVYLQEKGENPFKIPVSS